MSKVNTIKHAWCFAVCAVYCEFRTWAGRLLIWNFCRDYIGTHKVDMHVQMFFGKDMDILHQIYVYNPFPLILNTH